MLRDHQKCTNGMVKVEHSRSDSDLKSKSKKSKESKADAVGVEEKPQLSQLRIQT